MRIIGGGDDQGVDVRRAAHLVEIRRAPLGPPFRVTRVGALGGRITHGHQFGTRVQPQAGHMLGLADRTGTNGSNTNWGCGVRETHRRHHENGAGDEVPCRQRQVRSLKT